MKYTIHQLEQAIRQQSLNESQILLEKKLEEAHALFAQVKKDIRMMNESNDPTSNKVEDVIDVTESHLSDFKTPEDFQRFVEKNRDKVEAALKKMPEKKKSLYQKAWDLVCKAAKGTMSFIVSNFVSIAMAILVLTLGWVYRNELKYVWEYIKSVIDAWRGKDQEQRFKKYQEQAKKVAAAAADFTKTDSKKASNEIYKGVAKDLRTTEEGRKFLKELANLPVKYAEAAENLNGANSYSDEVQNDPTGIKTAFKSDGALTSALKNDLHGISIACRKACGFKPIEGDDKWDLFDLGYIQDDIDASKANEQFLKNVAKVEQEIYQACANAKDVPTAKQEIGKLYVKYARDIIDMSDEANATRSKATKTRTNTWMGIGELVGLFPPEVTLATRLMQK